MKIVYLLSVGIVGCSSMSWAMESHGGSDQLVIQEKADVVVENLGGADAPPSNIADLEANTRSNGRCMTDARRKCWRKCLGWSCGCIGGGAVLAYFVCKIGWGDDCPV